jgi:hypothetical protein
LSWGKSEPCAFNVHRHPEAGGWRDALRERDAAGIEAFAFEHADGQLVQLIWSVDGGEYEMALPRTLNNVEWLDVQGNLINVQGALRIGIEPIYRVDTPRNPLRLSSEGRRIQP